MNNEYRYIKNFNSKQTTVRSQRFYAAIVIISALLLFLSSSVSAQKTNDLETRIENIQNQIDKKEFELENLLTKYTSGYEKVRTLKIEIAELKLNLKKLLDEKFIRDLPNDQIELLKMIVIQNRQILQLLEKQ